MLDTKLSIKQNEDVEMIDTSIKKAEESNYVTIEGIFIKQDFDHLILDEDEISQYTTLTKSTLKQTLFIPFKYDVQILNFYLHSYFADIKVLYSNPSTHQLNPSSKYDLCFLIDDLSLFYFQRAEMLQLEWVTSPKTDLIADSLSLLILQVNEKPSP